MSNKEKKRNGRDFIFAVSLLTLLFSIVFLVVPALAPQIEAAVKKGSGIFESLKMTVKSENGPTISLDGSANVVKTEVGVGLTVTPAIDEGQTVNWVVHNTHASTPITITFTPGSLNMFWRDGVPFTTVDAQEANVYTFIRVGNNVYVAVVTDMQ